jgi:hypothetical protein
MVCCLLAFPLEMQQMAREIAEDWRNDEQSAR